MGYIKKELRKILCENFVQDIMPMLSRFDLESKTDERYSPMEHDGWHYRNFRKLVFESGIEIYIERLKRGGICESAWIYREETVLPKERIWKIVNGFKIMDYEASKEKPIKPPKESKLKKTNEPETPPR